MTHSFKYVTPILAEMQKSIVSLKEPPVRRIKNSSSMLRHAEK
jgi:hypothetical protein